MAERLKLGQLKKNMAVHIQMRSSYLLILAIYKGRMKDSDFDGKPEEWWRCFEPLPKRDSKCYESCNEFPELILRESRHGVDWIVWDDSFYKSTDALSVTWEEEQHE